MTEQNEKKIYGKGSTILCDHCDQPLYIIIKDVEDGQKVDFSILQPIIPQLIPERNDAVCKCIHCDNIVFFTSILPYEPYEYTDKDYFNSDDYDSMYKDAPPCVYEPVRKDACDPLKLWCDGSCKGAGHCIFNPFSEFYNMPIEEFKKVVKDAEDYILWLADYLETDEGKQMVKEFENVVLKNKEKQDEQND